MALRGLGLLTIAVTVALIALMLYAGEPGELWWWFLAVPIGVWIVGPSIAPYVWARYARDKIWFSWLMLAFLLLSSGWAASVYYDAFFVSTSSTSALIMIFAPFYQWGWLAITGLGSLGIVRLVTRRRAIR
jgi:hypothetical protein